MYANREIAAPGEEDEELGNQIQEEDLDVDLDLELAKMTVEGKISVFVSEECVCSSVLVPFYI